MKIIAIVGLVFVLLAGCENLLGDDDDNGQSPTDRSFNIERTGTSSVSGELTGDINGASIDETISMTVEHGLGDVELDQLIGVVFEGDLEFALVMYEALESKDIQTTRPNDDLPRGRFRMLGAQELTVRGETYYFNPGIDSTFELKAFQEGETFTGNFEIGMVVYEDQSSRDIMSGPIGDLNFVGEIVAID